MALLRHAKAVWRCPFLGAHRKWPAPGQNDAIDVVDDARSGIECAKGVIVEQRITGEGRPHAR
jgi:hypothetical protein